MAGTLELAIYSSALAEQVAAFTKFQQLAGQSPRLAALAFGEYFALQTPSSEATGAVKTVASYLESQADLFTDFGSEIESQWVDDKASWLQINIASNSTPEQEVAAKNVWRHGRIITFLTLLLASAPAPSNDGASPRGLPSRATLLTQPINV